MSAINVDQANFEAEVLKSDRPVLVDFWAPRCGPCRMVVPIVDEIAEEYPQYKTVKVNVDAEPKLAMQFDVMTIPTLLIFKGGQVVNKSVGVRSKAQILALLD